MNSDPGFKSSLKGIAAAATGQITVFPLKQEWERTLAGGVDAYAALGPDNTLLATSREKATLCSLDRATGELRWEFTGEGGSFSDPPAVSKDGTVYICNREHTVFAVDGKTGRQKWRRDEAATITSNAVAGEDGSIYFGESKGLTALTGGSGEKKWHVDIPEFINRATMGPDGIIYLSCGSSRNDGALYAIDTGSGSIKWCFKDRDNINASPAVGNDGTVYVGSQNWSFYALDGDRGTVKWSRQTGGSLMYGQPAIGTNGTVYFGSDDNYLYALDGKTGEEVWKRNLGCWLRSSPVLDRDDMLYMPGEKKLVVMESRKGEIKGEVMTKNMFNHFPKPLIDDEGTVYSTSYRGVFAVTGFRKSNEETGKNYQKALEEAKKDSSAQADGSPGEENGRASSDVIVDNGFIIIDGVKMEMKKEKIPS